MYKPITEENVLRYLHSIGYPIEWYEWQNTFIVTKETHEKRLLSILSKLCDKGFVRQIEPSDDDKLHGVKPKFVVTVDGSREIMRQILDH